ncbi:MAG: hypothetical protein COZ06_15665 [Armatimonadetes bacterium CG_4_10_14_3_um_filter_66_18]|nr:flippase-like domain-containing protein [Armatimonadota bacterium]OIO94346.1 MAG: hypothetical protein AUJ96_28785 [Armatimonadetes bacterium CG2_30_66_41]PIU87796.1 MAG: hypothetical protein COS65_32895 [Armatimonadetes bacterium CG06_land_8_20_14_3_00_66_21]PIX40987.1 MAG: hypothetical protein COZ57_24555 [Armatimonadetes bacterium CG_4_8_14_3_um_filter_66_20]PIY48834.1 MAG: hypothetical protein COZ06_15665 [Armatimonadetes bacterium CG_4_10_14_3_um_filter_66_18]PIZ43715.1 MAG: hypothetic
MRLLRATQVVVSVGILLLLCRAVDLPLLLRTLASARVAPLGLAVAIFFLGLLLRAVRWRAILNKETHAVGFVDSLLVTLVGGALNLVLPATGGEVAKSVYAYHRTGIRERAVAGSVVDKLVALLAAGLLGLAPSVAYRLWDLAGYNLLLVALLAVLVYFPKVLPWKLVTKLLRSLRIETSLEELKGGSALTPRVHVVCLVLSLLAWATTFVSVYFLFVAIRAENVSVGKVFMVVPLTTVARLFPFTLDGIGTAEAASVYFFGRAGIAPEAALAVQLLSRLIGSYLVGALGALVMLCTGRRRGTHPSAPECFESDKEAVET